MVIEKSRIRSLTISGFRGVRHPITLNFNKACQSMIIFGANAKGKSCIGDAVEWFFTGWVGELRKEGCSRVDYRHRLLNDAEDTIVAFQFRDTRFSSEIRLPPSLKQRYSNNTEEFSTYRDASGNELLILRHKDLRHFVDLTKSDKRVHLAKLIGMDEWEGVRTELHRATGKLESIVEDSQKRLHAREAEVAELMGVDMFSDEGCWEFANLQAQILKTSSEITDLSELASAVEQAQAEAVITERQIALNQLETLKEKLQQVARLLPDNLTNVRQFMTVYNQLCSTPESVILIHLIDLLKQGQEVLESGYWVQDICPLCEGAIAVDELLDHVREHLNKSEAFQEKRDEIEVARQQGIQEHDTVTRLFETLIGIDFQDSAQQLAFDSLKNRADPILESMELTLKSPLVAYEVLSSDCYSGLEQVITDTQTQITISIEILTQQQLELALVADEITRAEAFRKLSQLHGHLTTLQRLRRELEPIERQYRSMQGIIDAFQQLRRDTMTRVLVEISGNVSRYFTKIHPNEGFDEVRLAFLPDEDGIEFHIYYRGEEITPPRKFLSESYLNSLGVCLFLATARTFNKLNGFLVLDDIVNSFDQDHRAELAKLLIEEFEDFQLVVLTHDNIWFELFRRLAADRWISQRIQNWSYADGVQLDVAPDSLLGEIRQALQKSDIGAAAPKIRTYAESRLKKLNEELGVFMLFKRGSRNEERVISELAGDLRQHLQAKGFPNLRPLDDFIASTFVTNFGSHDRLPEATTISVGDLEFALARVEEIVSLFKCPKCNKPIWYTRTFDYKRMNCECGHWKL